MQVLDTHDAEIKSKSLNNFSTFGHVYSLPQGIEVICSRHGDHGVVEVKSNSQVYYQVVRGSHKVVLWNDLTMTNPLEDNKMFKKEKRRLKKCINCLFGKAGDGVLGIGFGRYEVRTRGTNECQISCYLPNFCKPVVFQPFSFLKDGERSGGAYFTVSSTLSVEKEVINHQSKKQAVNKIITGMCLSPNLLMIDENRDYVDLVDKVYLNVPSFKETKIVDFMKVDGPHPYEMANLEMLRNLFPFFTAISQSSSPSLYFHLPLPEYLLHGISLFLEGNMTVQALDRYADLLSGYVSTLRKNLSQKLENARIHFSSPLETLTENAVRSSGSFASHFFQDLGIPLEQDDFDRSMGRRVAAAALEYLKERPGISGDVWRRLSEQALKDEQELSLKCLTNWSSSVHVAMQSFASESGEVAVVDDAWERRIIQVFKKYIQTDDWPSIQCFHWLMPVGMSSISSLFHLPVSPGGELSSIFEMEEIIHGSSIRISTHAEYQ